MTQIQKLSDSEWDIMQMVWQLPQPVTSTQLVEAFEQSKGWKAQTVSTFLARLVEKGVLGFTKQGKTNFYTSKVTMEQYRQMETQSFLKDVHGGSVKSFFAALYEAGDITPQELEELKSWLKEKA